jgi:carbamoyl-phosphate synthase small subunit
MENHNGRLYQYLLISKKIINILIQAMTTISNATSCDNITSNQQINQGFNQQIDNRNKDFCKQDKILFSKKSNAILILADGSYFIGDAIGKLGVVTAEICFNTAITGYQEILTDPSYYKQIINFTFPHIGNVGINDNDNEGKIARASGLVVRENITNPANYRSLQHFNEWLIEQNLIGISNIDTRKITNIIRKTGPQNAIIASFEDGVLINDQIINDLFNTLKLQPDLSNNDLAYDASEKEQYHWSCQGKWQMESNQYNKNKNFKYRVVAFDYGIKYNILRCLNELDCELIIMPANASFADIIANKPDGVFLSNGPGNPAATAKYAKEVIAEIIKAKIPLFGICLGHQLLSLAIGANTVRMHQGHRGANHPVKNIDSQKIEITSQNHGFAVDAKTIPDNARITHISLFDGSVEGLELNDSPAFSVQYHPESSPGPSDSFYLFEKFIDLMKKSKTL